MGTMSKQEHTFDCQVQECTSLEEESARTQILCSITGASTFEQDTGCEINGL